MTMLAMLPAPPPALAPAAIGASDGWGWDDTLVIAAALLTLVLVAWVLSKASWPQRLFDWVMSGREFKPVALFMSLLMLTLAIYNVVDAGVFAASRLGDVVAVMAFGSWAMLCGGWYFKVQRMAELGLAAAAFVYLARGLFAFFTGGIWAQPGWLSLWAAGLAAGAFYQEVRDPRDRGAKGD